MTMRATTSPVTGSARDTTRVSSLVTWEWGGGIDGHP